MITNYSSPDKSSLSDPNSLAIVSLINGTGNAQSISQFKDRLDQFWTESGYGHNEMPKAYNC